MSQSPSFRRNPLVISGNVLASGDRTATIAAGGPDAVLRSYLIFVRDMRGQRREPSIQLRNEDISVLAAHLGIAEDRVLGGLLDLMGATRAQRSTMLALLAAGALTVVLSGSIVSSLSDDGVSVDLGRLANAVQAAVTGSDARSDASVSASAAGAVETPAATATEGATGNAVAPEVVAKPVVEAPTAPAVPVVAASNTVITDVTTVTPSLDVLQSPAAAAASTAAAAAAAAATEPVSIGVTADGSLVASVAPPVPETSDEPVGTAVLPDGSTVGVAAPPVPPAPDEGVATGELPDGTTVGVAAPPVPPAPQD